MHRNTVSLVTGPRIQFVSRIRRRGYTMDEVRACIVSEDGDKITVDINHPAYPRAPRRTKGQPHPYKQQILIQSGPGTELKALLAKIGIHASPTCGCNKMARQMDAWGPEESLNHIEEIVDVMEATAKARKLPFLRTAGRILVRQACRIARKKGNGK